MRTKVSAEQIAELEDKQGNRCAICGEPSSPKSALCVDHCHDSGDIRGLLCKTCNLGLGSFKDRIVLLQAAVEYLMRKPAIKAGHITPPPTIDPIKARRAERIAWWSKQCQP
jgi:recombination endonuclease VII